MKKFLALVLIAGLLLCFAGCEAVDYSNALQAYNGGDYAQARDLFLSLGDYADSPAMAQLASQKYDYETAELYYSTGDHRLALPLYEKLEMYMDCPIKALACRYQIGLGCIESGAYEEALTWLEPLGSYEDCLQQVLLAKWLWLYSTVQTKGGSLETRTSEATVSLTANEDGTLTLGYHKSAYLLGLPYESSLTMVLEQGVRSAAYTAVYASIGASQIQETATGTLDITLFSTEAKLPVSSFSQVRTDPEGGETTSTDPGDAFMMKNVLAEAQSTLSEGLPALLSQSGVTITAQELGFAALQ